MIPQPHMMPLVILFLGLCIYGGYDHGSNAGSEMVWPAAGTMDPVSLRELMPYQTPSYSWAVLM